MHAMDLVLHTVMHDGLHGVFMDASHSELYVLHDKAIKNPFIWGPETAGAVLAISALVLMVTFPR